jgi:hypothetical protein
MDRSKDTIIAGAHKVFSRKVESLTADHPIEILKEMSLTSVRKLDKKALRPVNQ